MVSNVARQPPRFRLLLESCIGNSRRDDQRAGRGSERYGIIRFVRALTTIRSRPTRSSPRICLLPQCPLYGGFEAVYPLRHGFDRGALFGLIAVRCSSDPHGKKRFVMHSAFKTGIIVLSLSVVPLSAAAGTLEGAGIGAGVGAVVLGPVGAVAGGAIGAVVGGPNIVTRRHYRSCRRDYWGHRHCTWH